MLFAGCSNCQRIVPLFCGGLMFPHMPMEAVQVGNVVGCMWCGVSPPFFTCTFCMNVQRLFVPPPMGMGMPGFDPRMLQQQHMQVAPVVQAPQGAGEGMVRSMMKDVGKSFASSFGQGLAKELLGAFFGGGS